MTAHKEFDSLAAEILHELADLDPEDWDAILRSWKATLEANKDNGDWKGYHFILCQKISPQTEQGRSLVASS